MPAGAECPGDMASPDNDMLIAALVVVGLLAVGLAVMLVWRTREVRSVREIGERLHLAEKTVKHHMTNILQKLHVRSRTEAALASLRRNSRGSAP